MNKKKLKKLALKGVCGGLLISAPGLVASQGSEAMANFIANSSGQAHSNYLAGGCGGGCGGGAKSNVARNQAQAQPQHSCGGGSANNMTAYEYQSYSGSNTGSHQGWNQYPDQYQSQSGCRSHSGYNTGNSQGYQPQGGYDGANQNWNQSNQYHSQSGCRSHGGCGGGNAQSWNQQQGTYSNNQRNPQNQKSYADSNNDGIEVEYDNVQSNPNRQTPQPKKPGQMALNDSTARTLETPVNQQGDTNLNRNNPSQQWPNQAGQTQGQIQNSQAGQSAWQGSQNTPRVQGQLATGVVAQNKKLSESEFKNALNPAAKAEYETLSPSGKTLALKMANQSCAHQNDCKGQNACKGKNNSCAGQGGCKGTAETNFKDKNLAVKAAKMAEKRNNAVNPAPAR